MVQLTDLATEHILLLLCCFWPALLEALGPLSYMQECAHYHLLLLHCMGLTYSKAS